jgi:hypothetical protein
LAFVEGLAIMSEHCAYLRYKAEKCRAYAEQMGDNQTREALRKLAADYAARADDLESKEPAARPPGQPSGSGFDRSGS